EKPMKDVGLGLRLPTYASGPAAVGWWAMWITMLGDSTAFASVVFGFFFYWTSRADFLPEGALHADGLLVLASVAALGIAWAATLGARHLNRAGRGGAAKASLAAGLVLALAGGAALALSVMDLAPSTHVYPAIVCALVIWTGAHVAVGVLMQGYCLAGLIFGKIDHEHDADLWNVTLYWHFHILTVLVTAAVIGIAPRLL
ncbi:cytochrome ubiquinol oxidase subunit I, partial [Frigidibacter sp. MR17.14]